MPGKKQTFSRNKETGKTSDEEQDILTEEDISKNSTTPSTQISSIVNIPSSSSNPSTTIQQPQVTQTKTIKLPINFNETSNLNE